MLVINLANGDTTVIRTRGEIMILDEDTINVMRNTNVAYGDIDKEGAARYFSTVINERAASFQRD
jgi:hypothetical protein